MTNLSLAYLGGTGYEMGAIPHSYTGTVDVSTTTDHSNYSAYINNGTLDVPMYYPFPLSSYSMGAFIKISDLTSAPEMRMMFKVSHSISLVFNTTSKAFDIYYSESSQNDTLLGTGTAALTTGWHHIYLNIHYVSSNTMEIHYFLDGAEDIVYVGGSSLTLPRDVSENYFEKIVLTNSSTNNVYFDDVLGYYVDYFDVAVILGTEIVLPYKPGSQSSETSTCYENIDETPPSNVDYCSVSAGAGSYGIESYIFDYESDLDMFCILYVYGAMSTPVNDTINIVAYDEIGGLEAISDSFDVSSTEEYHTYIYQVIDNVADFGVKHSNPGSGTTYYDIYQFVVEKLVDPLVDTRVSNLPGGYEVKFTIPALPINRSVGVKSDIGIALNQSPSRNTINVQRNGSSGFYIVLIDGHDDIVEKAIMDTSTSELSNSANIKINFHNQYATIYINDKWAHTFFIENVFYDDFDGTLTFVASDSMTITDINISELHSWRDSIYIEMESNATGAIGSIIQERPINIVPKYDGTLDVFYEKYNRDIATGL